MQVDTPDLATAVLPALIRSNDVNMTFQIPYHNGGLVDSFVLDLQETSSSVVLQSHAVSIVKCRDPNAPNASVQMVCPLASQKGYMDCQGVEAPLGGVLGNCSGDGWLYHTQTCHYECNSGFSLSGAQPYCEYGRLSASAVCIVDNDDSGPVEDDTVVQNTDKGFCRYSEDDANTTDTDEEGCEAMDLEACAAVALSGPACVATGVCEFTASNPALTQSTDTCAPSNVAACTRYLWRTCVHPCSLQCRTTLHCVCCVFNRAVFIGSVQMDGTALACLMAGACVYTPFVAPTNQSCTATNASAVPLPNCSGWVEGEHPPEDCVGLGGGGSNCSYAPASSGTTEGCTSSHVR